VEHRREAALRVTEPLQQRTDRVEPQPSLRNGKGVQAV